MSNHISLYDLIGMKRKNSVLKSVMINKDKNSTYSGCYIEVEAYDGTFTNATRHPSGQDKVYETIDERQSHRRETLLTALHTPYCGNKNNN